MGDGSGDAKRKRLRFHHPGTFSGTAIDGPMRGQRIEHYDRWYQCCEKPRMPCSPWATIPETAVQGFVYQWSFSLGQWCMRS